jgi:hypothetical protein
VVRHNGPLKSAPMGKVAPCCARKVGNVEGVCASTRRNSTMRLVASRSRGGEPPGPRHRRCDQTPPPGRSSDPRKKRQTAARGLSSCWVESCLVRARTSDERDPRDGPGLAPRNGASEA